MCGVSALVNFRPVLKAKDLMRATSIIKHRGPDDEGYLTFKKDEAGDSRVQKWSGDDTANSSRQRHSIENLPEDLQFSVGLGHRRLSILDLSSNGHQPMTLPSGHLAISFNGEIYNYIEIREELVRKGHVFLTHTDTEVILHAWQEWGIDALSKFNGMFAFVILDYNKKTVHAVRDRFGVKPLYYTLKDEYLFISSEIKQITTIPNYVTEINHELLEDYLATGAVDHTDQTFHSEIKKVPSGAFISLNLDEGHRSFQISKWYYIKKNLTSTTYEDSVSRFRELLIDSVKLRLRSDVKFGACLSGGLDSSTIVSIIASLLDANKGAFRQESVTARFADRAFDEWRFANEVINKTHSIGHEIFPEFDDLKNQFDRFLWHQDEPTASSSQFSQWMVFSKSQSVGLKVMIDGQGADEQLAGYSGNEVSLFSEYLRRGKWLSLGRQALAYRRANASLPFAYLIGSLQVNFPSIVGKLPDKLQFFKASAPQWLLTNKNISPDLKGLQTLRSSLTNQILVSPLPSLLRYEDKSSMAFGIESRTPFMDYRLIEFTLSLGSEQVYHNSIRKRILRDAFRAELPDAVANRKDKMGFVTPEEIWFKSIGSDWFRSGVEETVRLRPDLFKKIALFQLFDNVASGKRPYNSVFWRIASIGKFLKMNKVL